MRIFIYIYIYLSVLYIINILLPRNVLVRVASVISYNSVRSISDNASITRIYLRHKMLETLETIRFLWNIWSDTYVGK